MLKSLIKTLCILSCCATAICAADAEPVRLDARHWGMFGGADWMDIDFAANDLPIHPEGWAYEWFSTPSSRANYWENIHTQRQNGFHTLQILGLSGNIDDRKIQLYRYFTDEGGIETYPEDLVGVALSHEQNGSMDAVENELYDYIKRNWPEVQVYKFYSFPLAPYSLLTDGITEKCDGYLYDDYYNKDPQVFRRRVMRFIITGKPLVMIIWASEPWESTYFNEDWIEGLPADEQNGLIINAPNSALEQYYRMAAGVLREFGLPVGNFGVSGGAGSSSAWYGGTQPPNRTYIRDQVAFILRDRIRACDGQPQATSDYADGDSIEINTDGAFTYTDSFTTDGIYKGLGTLNDASIIGFRKLLQLPVSTGALATRDDSGSPGQVELIYRFHAASGSLNSISATLTGSVDESLGGVNTVGLSLNGRDMTEMSSATVTGGSDYDNCSVFFVHVIMSYDSSPSGRPANVITDLLVDVRHQPADTPNDEADNEAREDN